MRRITERSASSLVVLTFLAISTFSSISLVHTDGTYFGVEYSYDRSYYHPTSPGKLTLNVKNSDNERAVLIFSAELTIANAGSFFWDMMRKPDDPHIMPDASSYRIDPGETAVLEIYFRIPPDTIPGKYVFTWVISMGVSKFLAAPLTKSDTLMIYAMGEEPSYNPLGDPLMLVPAAALMMMIVYIWLRRKGRVDYLTETPSPKRRERPKLPSRQ